MEATATLPALLHDRVCDWFDELNRVAVDVASLPPAARRAVTNVLGSLRPEVEPDLTVVQTRRLDEVLAALGPGKTKAPGGALRSIALFDFEICHSASAAEPLNLSRVPR